MIFFKAQGRLGNQIFQYAFLQSKKRKGEKIFSIGFDELIETFEINDIYNFSRKNKYLVYLINKGLFKAINLFKTLCLIRSISVKEEVILNSYTRETNNIKIKRGLTNHTYINDGFFQSHTCFKNDFRLKIKDHHHNKALELLSKIPSNYLKVFVHIRKGDYKNFKVYGKSTLLPNSYYINMIKKIIDEHENPFFIFLSDDQLENISDYNNIKHKIVFNRNNYFVDFAIMTLCDGAILSPSSFGWWGAFFMKSRDLIFAPKFWLGFNSKVNFPTNPTPPFFKTILIK